MQKAEMILFNTMNNFEFPEIQKFTICHFWDTYWGSFTRGLSTALNCADINNERIIRKTWAIEIKEYYNAMLKFEDTLWD